MEKNRDLFVGCFRTESKTLNELSFLVARLARLCCPRGEVGEVDCRRRLPAVPLGWIAGRAAQRGGLQDELHGGTARSLHCLRVPGEVPLGLKTLEGFKKAPDCRLTPSFISGVSNVNPDCWLAPSFISGGRAFGSNSECHIANTGKGLKGTPRFLGN